MISNYKKISIIYGHGGHNCAVALKKRLLELHTEKGFPIDPHIIADEVMDGKEIFTRVRDIISSSSLCIILLTFDDIAKTRVRQNVLVEIGMASILVGKDNFIVFSEKSPLPNNFPSDIRGILNPNLLDIRKQNEAVEKITNAIMEKLDLKSQFDETRNEKYLYDYLHVLDGIPDEVFSEKPDLQMKHILEEWLRMLESFTFAEERILFFLERIVFIPIFPADDDLKHFLNKTQILITEGKGAEELDAAVKLSKKIMRYEFFREFKDINGFHKASGSDYRQLAEEIKELDLCQFNWFVRVIQLDYAALAGLHYCRSKDADKSGKLEVLESVISDFNEVESLIAEFCRKAGDLWSGYVLYNLSRAYEQLYNIDVSPEKENLLEKVREYSQKAISTRREWINKMKGVFSTALSFDYFLAQNHEFELYSSIPSYYNGDPANRARKIQDILAELSCYCESTGLKKLLILKERLEKMAEGN